MASKGKSFRKRRNDSSDDEAAPAAAPPAAKRAATGDTAAYGAAAVNAGSSAGGSIAAEILSFSSAKSSGPHPVAGGAFATSEIDTAADRDGLALLERKLELQHESMAAMESGQPREYKGLAAYSNFIGKDAAEARTKAKISGTMGPLRAPTNVRSICRVDYQPELCKDYKETGFCPFGDSCKFLHDRSEYKAGWQVDKEWQATQKAKAAALERKLLGLEGGDGDEDVGDGDGVDAAGGAGAAKKRDDELPFACHICRKPFTNPIVTNCGHYFCERCAVDRYSKDPLCAICNKQTMGVFNAARKLIARLAAAGRAAGADPGAGSSRAAAGSSGSMGSMGSMGGGGWADASAGDAGGWGEPAAPNSSAGASGSAAAADDVGGWGEVADPSSAAPEPKPLPAKSADEPGSAASAAAAAAMPAAP